MKKLGIRWLLDHIWNAPLLVWVMLGFSITYLFFFIRPIFFSSTNVMQFPNYVPNIVPIGADLRGTLNFSSSWLVNKLYTDNKPPLVILLFAPLLRIPFTWAYKIVTVVTVVCYGIVAFVLPLKIAKGRRISPILLLIFSTGLFSYGFQFELERGQFNVIAIFLCFLAIWIFHYQNKYRYLAYILFTISVQLKVYPLIFIVMLIRDWRDWKNNILRFVLLGAANFAVLFVLGTHAFVEFINTINGYIVSPYIWIGNHSILSFATVVADRSNSHGWTWLNNHAGWIQIGLLAVVGICIFLVVFQTYHQKKGGVNPLLLLACTIAALLIPSTSHDYTLSILAGPVALLFLNNGFWAGIKRHRLQPLLMVLLFIFSTAYFSTLYSYTNKTPPYVIETNFSALFIMLLIVTVFSVLSRSNLEEEEPEPVENI